MVSSLHGDIALYLTKSGLGKLKDWESSTRRCRVEPVKLSCVHERRVKPASVSAGKDLVGAINRRGQPSASRDILLAKSRLELTEARR